MTDLSAAPLLMTLPVCFAGGVALGAAYFRALRATAEMLVRGGSPLLGAALTLGRLALIGGGFYLAVLAGGLALLSALAGVLCGRRLMLRRTREAGG